MKTLIKNETNLSLYVFDDGIELSIGSDNIVTPKFIISDLNSSNTTLIEGVTPPEDWVGCKYTYANSVWVLNSAWVEAGEAGA